MKENTFVMNDNFVHARTEYNQIYKNFLYISEYYREIFKEEYVDLFTASTFSKVVPTLIEDKDYEKMIKGNSCYANYPSPEGNSTLLNAFHQFIRKIYDLDFSNYETMVCQGTMQAIDAISCILKGSVVFVMDSTVTFAKSIPTANGAEVVLIKTNDGILDIDDLTDKIHMYSNSKIKYLYINYPNNPTGAQITEGDLAQIIDVTQKYDIRIVHDHDICLTSYDSERPVISIFKNEKAIRNSIEIYTLSKEFGLSGLRIGIIVGNREFVKMIKYHNYEMNIMIPTLNQKIAELALNRMDINDTTNKIYNSMKTLVEGFRKLGWNNLRFPQAGISFLLEVPEAFVRKYNEQSGELFAFYLQKEFGIGVGPAKCNCLYRTNYIRVLSMEPGECCGMMFEKIRNYVSPQMETSNNLYNEYIDIIKLAEKSDVR